MQFSYKFACFVNADNYSLSFIRHDWCLDAHPLFELKHNVQSVSLCLGFSTQTSWKNLLLGYSDLPLELAYPMNFIVLYVILLYSQ